MLKKLSHVVMISAILTSASLTPPFLASVEASNPFKNLERKLKKTQKQIQKGVNKFSKSPEAKVLGVIAAGVIAAKLFDDNRVGIAVGVVAGTFIHKELLKSLNQEQQTRATRTTVSTVVTGEDQNWETDDGVKGTVKVVKDEEVKAPVAIVVDKKKIDQVPPLDFIGESYELTANSNLRGGPDTTYERVGYVKAGTKINIVGKVKDAPWYFVSQDGVGSGFVFEELVKPSAASIIGEEKPKPETDDLFEVEVAQSKQCRTIEQTITLADGTEKTEQLTACKGANGWEIQEPSAS